MGPNGSGKSTLVMATAGYPHYRLSPDTKIELDGKEITHLEPHERGKLGLFVSFQNPPPVPGVNIVQLLRLLVPAGDYSLFYDRLKKLGEDLGLTEDYLARSLNQDFSGGEKKKTEILQAEILNPRYLILDEIDTGLDIDALKLVAKRIRRMVEKKKTGVLIITHYLRILRYLKPDKVIVMEKGRIVREGTFRLAKEIEEKGYIKTSS